MIICITVFGKKLEEIQKILPLEVWGYLRVQDRSGGEHLAQVIFNGEEPDTEGLLLTRTILALKANRVEHVVAYLTPVVPYKVMTT